MLVRIVALLAAMTVVHGFLPPRFGVNVISRASIRTSGSSKTSLRDLKDMSGVAFDDLGCRIFPIFCILDEKMETKLSDEFGPFTLFLPQEDAFKEKKMHGESTFTMLNGQDIVITVEGNKTMVHGKHNTSAEIVKANIHCANGVIHLIDNFLVPDYAEYEPPPYNSSLYDSFYPPLEELPPSNLPVPDDWYDEDEPSIGGNSLWGSPSTASTSNALIINNGRDGAI
eukprot:gene8765-10368_t